MGTASGIYFQQLFSEVCFNRGISKDQDYLNPCNCTTSITFILDELSPVSLSLLDIKGRKIKTLPDGQRGPGAHTVQLDGEGIPSGIYDYILTTDKK